MLFGNVSIIHVQLDPERGQARVALALKLCNHCKWDTITITIYINIYK